MSLQTRLKATIGKTGLNFLIGRASLNDKEAIAFANQFLRHVLALLIFEIGTWIKKHVPKRTGKLRKDILSILNKSKIQNLAMTVFLGSELDYAKRVNEMTTGEVRHYNTWREHDGSKARDQYGNLVKLDDPLAFGAWFDELLKYATQRRTIAIRKAKIALANSLGVNMGGFKIGG